MKDANGHDVQHLIGSDLGTAMADGRHNRHPMNRDSTGHMLGSKRAEMGTLSLDSIKDEKGTDSP
jgi:hypothetical protein